MNDKIDAIWSDEIKRAIRLERRMWRRKLTEALRARTGTYTPSYPLECNAALVALTRLSERIFGDGES